MAIKKDKKQETNAEAQELTIKVTRVRDFTEKDQEGCTISFDMEVNGINIYGCWYREGKNKKGEDYTMAAFPSHKGKDGKFYNYAYVKLSDADVENISKQIENLL